MKLKMDNLKYCNFEPYNALYIHIPFCVKRCNYCSFTTNDIKKDSIEIDHYIEKISLNIRRAVKEGKLSEIETVYIGGGTPSFVGIKRLSSLLYMISTSIKLENVLEFSMEANPESLTQNMVKDIFALGVDRISIGVQSFDDDVLKILGRSHDSQTAIDAINSAKIRFKNISIDLMCGIPGQSLESFKDSLQQAIDLGVQHISVYPLSIEPNTVFGKKVASNKMNKINQDIQADHMELANKILTQAGYKHYEIASYGKPNKECKHNLIYWTAKPYLGIGLSATSMIQNASHRLRITNNIIDEELDNAQMIAEDLMLSMRTKFGASYALIDKAYEIFGDNRAKYALEDMVKLGLVKKTKTGYHPTDKGWLVGNEIFLKLLELSD